MITQINFVDGNELDLAQITQVTELAFYTGYHMISSQNNKLGLSPIEFHREVTILPALKYIRAMLDKDNNVAGFYLALTQTETKELFASTPNYYADELADLMEVADKIFNLYLEESNYDDLIVHYSSIRYDLQGLGLFKVLMKDLIKLAHAKQCSRLFAATWTSKTKSLDIFKYYGSQERKVLDFTDTICKDKIVNLVTEVAEIESRL